MPGLLVPLAAAGAEEAAVCDGAAGAAEATGESDELPLGSTALGAAPEPLGAPWSPGEAIGPVLPAPGADAVVLPSPPAGVAADGVVELGAALESVDEAVASVDALDVGALVVDVVVAESAAGEETLCACAAVEDELSLTALEAVDVDLSENVTRACEATGTGVEDVGGGVTGADAATVTGGAATVITGGGGATFRTIGAAVIACASAWMAGLVGDERGGPPDNPNESLTTAIPLRPAAVPTGTSLRERVRAGSARTEVGVAAANATRDKDRTVVGEGTSIIGKRATATES